jgi:hypothetical protein
MVLAAIQVQAGGPVDRAQLGRLSRKWGVDRREVRRRLALLPLPPDSALLMPAIRELARVEINPPTIH